MAGRQQAKGAGAGGGSQKPSGGTVQDFCTLVAPQATTGLGPPDHRQVCTDHGHYVDRFAKTLRTRGRHGLVSGHVTTPARRFVATSILPQLPYEGMCQRADWPHETYTTPARTESRLQRQPRRGLCFCTVLCRTRGLWMRLARDPHIAAQFIYHIYLTKEGKGPTRALLVAFMEFQYRLSGLIFKSANAARNAITSLAGLRVSWCVC